MGARRAPVFCGGVGVGVGGVEAAEACRRVLTPDILVLGTLRPFPLVFLIFPSNGGPKGECFGNAREGTLVESRSREDIGSLRGLWVLDGSLSSSLSGV